MKQIALIFILTAVFAITAMAQKPYSMENLQQASQEELDVYLNKALKQQQTGKTLNIVGGSILGATALSSVTFAHQLELGVVVLAFFGGLAGLGTLAVGIPMNITGKKRVERINTLRNLSFNSTTLNLKPYSRYDNVSQIYQHGIALSIRF